MVVSGTAQQAGSRLSKPSTFGLAFCLSSKGPPTSTVTQKNKETMINITKH